MINVDSNVPGLVTIGCLSNMTQGEALLSHFRPEPGKFHSSFLLHSCSGVAQLYLMACHVNCWCALTHKRVWLSCAFGKKNYYSFGPYRKICRKYTFYSIFQLMAQVFEPNQSILRRHYVNFSQWMCADYIVIQSFPHHIQKSCSVYVASATCNFNIHFFFKS